MEGAGKELFSIKKLKQNHQNFHLFGCDTGKEESQI